MRALRSITTAATCHKIRSRSFIVNNLLSKSSKNSKKYSTKYIWLCKPGYESHIENELSLDLKIDVSIFKTK
jgi:hypothetical protein